MSRKSFIALFFAFLFPRRNKPDEYSIQEIESRWHQWQQRHLVDRTKTLFGKNKFYDEYRKQTLENISKDLTGDPMFTMKASKA